MLGVLMLCGGQMVHEWELMLLHFGALTFAVPAHEGNFLAMGWQAGVQEPLDQHE